MAKKNKPEKLTEREKEQQRLTIPFDKSKMFITNLNTLFDSLAIFKEWEIDPKSIALKGISLKIQFKIKDTAIEKEIDALDRGQKRMGDFMDPDMEPDNVAEMEPD